MKKAFLTIDLDWASEEVIKRALEEVARLSVPVTFFQTHRSETLLSFCRDHESELEWHPNFMPGSSHGETVGEIIRSLTGIPSERKVVRCHLYHHPEPQFSEFLRLTGIKATSNDLSLLSPKRISSCRGITEIPLFFEDGCFIKSGKPFEASEVIGAAKGSDNLVFLFHPIHIAFNSRDYSVTRSLKDGLTRQEYRSIGGDLISEKRFKGYGTADLLREVVFYLKENGYSFALMKEAIDD